MADNEDDLPIPEGIWWDGKEMMFRDTKGNNKGTKFFDEWKERRDEFPRSAQLKEREVKRRRPLPPPLAEAIEEAEEEAFAASVAEVGGTNPIDPEMLHLAQVRKGLYDAYVYVGFSREEALELCTR